MVRELKKIVDEFMEKNPKVPETLIMKRYYTAVAEVETGSFSDAVVDLVDQLEKIKHLIDSNEK